MDDTLSINHKDKDLAAELGALLHDHRASEVVVLDLREQNSWTDFFVIATVTSSAHVQGLHRHIKDFTNEKGIEILRRHRKVPKDEEWSLIDLGNIVVHLMTNRARTFYELERLWSGAEVIFRS